MGLKHMTCDIVLHTALSSEPSTSFFRRAGQMQTQFCTPYSVNEVKYIPYVHVYKYIR